ncbi:hypothetical protein VDP97_03655 [Xanthomonas campestris pv. campestris]|uniref:Uncharacterized protein n=1 Tax=Xanthomonas campestris pv. campestris (strain B100) TaxID=509169 RepID=B0RQT6_XANCB|nr:hypothetical protein [Xanthomonas campestris]MDO0789213.1 hypothetical protein [Xanthomonas campestris pv. campestris]MDO0836317.1 hypothetical protein [Xanthomonas campestris pv. campestris]MDO0840722.1 hypothetical protein [Xanthomonas campestris pv. campestris]MDO0844671.1 hypothetical protein [Xanthomonas campestris pv. campestris]MEA0619166.1 hypothetical protein [Xanthomonas campestris pv. campestris]
MRHRTPAVIWAAVVIFVVAVLTLALVASASWRVFGGCVACVCVLLPVVLFGTLMLQPGAGQDAFASAVAVEAAICLQLAADAACLLAAPLGLWAGACWRGRPRVEPARPAERTRCSHG